MNNSEIFFGGHVPGTVNGTNEIVVRALSNVIINTLIPLHPSLAITLSSRSNHVKYWFHDIVQNLFNVLVMAQLYSVDLHRPTFSGTRRYVNLLLIDSYKALLDTNLATINAKYDTPEYYFIFLKYRGENNWNQLQLILNYCLNNLWIHCDVMVETNCGKVLVYTYYPYLDGHCQKATPILINEFDGKNMKFGNPMFPDKLTNIHGCSLTMITYNVPPYVELKQRGKEIIADGFEMILMRELQKKLNFSLEFEITPGGLKDWFYYNDSIMPFFRRLNGRKANFTMANVRRTPILDRIVTPSFTHYYSPLVAATLQSLHKHNPIEALGFPFPPAIWITALVFVILVTGNSVYLHFKKKHIIPAFRLMNFTSIQVMCGVSISKEPKSAPARLVFVWWLWFTFILRCVYQSLLFQLIRTQMYKENVQTIDNLVRGDYLGTMTYSMSRFISETFFTRTAPMKFHFLNVSNEVALLHFLEDNREDKIFSLISLDTLSYYNSVVSPDTQFYILKEIVLNSQITIYFVKHSYFGEKFNAAILQLEASGMIQAWHRFHVEYKYKKWFNGNSQIIVGIKDLYGLLCLFETMLIVAFGVFITELIIKYFEKRQLRKQRSQGINYLIRTQYSAFQGYAQDLFKN